MAFAVLLFLVFLAVGSVFLLANLLVGRLVRPNKPSPEKSQIYECGEEPIGTAWIQFDLRFYVVALLFVIFDVEIAFFFPWAVVFGPLTTIGAGNPAIGGAPGRLRPNPPPPDRKNSGNSRKSRALMLRGGNCPALLSAGTIPPRRSRT